MNKPLVSVIVPVYNTEQFVGECIESILNQTFTDFELILVNDGSNDGSLGICNSFLQSDDRIRVIDQENGGVTKARKAGVEKSNGQYILFVDSDDTIPADSIATLVSYANDDTDIVIGALADHDNSFQSLRKDLYIERCIMGKIYPGPVGKLFIRKIFTDSVFDIPREIVKGEDMLMNIRVSFNCKNGVLMVPDVIYEYRQHGESCMAKFHTTIEYEGNFYKQMVLSLPSSYAEKYISNVVDKAFEVWHDFFGYKYRLPDNYKSFELYHVIHDNISKRNTSISRIDRILMELTNPLCRYILINFKRICRSIARKR